MQHYTVENMKRILMIVAALWVSGLSAAHVYAEEIAFDVPISSVNKHEVVPLGEGHVVLLVRMDETVADVEGAGPWAGAKGPCAGAVEIQSDRIKGSGKCHFTDADGDAFVIDWTATALNAGGGPDGIFTMSSGTGKYADAVANGYYSDVPIDDGATSEVRITGVLRF